MQTDYEDIENEYAMRREETLNRVENTLKTGGYFESIAVSWMRNSQFKCTSTLKKLKQS